MNFLKSVLTLALVSGFAVSSAQAQTAMKAPASSNGGIHGVVSFGFTVGGDKLASATYTNGTDVRITAGGLANFKGGVEFGVANNLAIQTTIGYHVDRANATNGSITFQRFPLEVLAMYSVTPQFRIGGGLRAALSPKLSGSGVANIGAYDYNTKAGLVLEGEYRPTSSLGITVRAVSEKYGVSGSNSTIDGSHGGLGLNYYF